MGDLMAVLRTATRSQHIVGLLIIIMSCLQRRSSIAQLDPPFLRCRLCSVSPRCAARHDMVLACGCAAHLFVLTEPHRCFATGVAPVLIGWPSAMYATAVCHRCSFGWMSYFFRLLWVASQLPLRDFCGLTQEAGRLRRNYCAKRAGLCRWSVSCLVRSFWQ